eukprot:TRINITY_DN11467_c0_g1_i1.p1 TRINITY_DN11467_c0_g1~~TRINITY_DN11467_c0_g1_i1.p1  ORF type:complete len:294 (+),score=36.54 TRINITY_DN11467_c0_g1_i1:54-935(+)
MVALLRIAVALGALLWCSASPSLPGEGGGSVGPFGDATVEFTGGGGGGLITGRPTLAAPGEGYKTDVKRAFVHIERGTTDPAACEGRFVVIDISAVRQSQTSHPPRPSDQTYDFISIQYTASKYRDCAADESSSSSGAYSYGTSGKCCSDGIHLYGYPSARPTAFTITQDKRGLSHAKVNQKFSLYSATGSTSSGGGLQDVATAVLALQVDCTAVNSRTTMFTSEVCSAGKCFSTAGEGSEYKCRGKFGIASVSGTIEIRGEGALKLDLSSPPAGYVVTGRLERQTDNEQASA